MKRVAWRDRILDSLRWTSPFFTQSCYTLPRHSRPTRYHATSREAVILHCTPDTMGFNGKKIRQAYGVWVEWLRQVQKEVMAQICWAIKMTEQDETSQDIYIQTTHQSMTIGRKSTHYLLSLFLLSPSNVILFYLLSDLNKEGFLIPYRRKVSVSHLHLPQYPKNSQHSQTGYPSQIMPTQTAHPTSQPINLSILLPLWGIIVYQRLAAQRIFPTCLINKSLGSKTRKSKRWNNACTPHWSLTWLLWQHRHR